MSNLYFSWTGLPKHCHDDVGIEEFELVTVQRQQPMKLRIARLERKCLKIYLTSHVKRCLSRLTTKRLFDKKTRTKRAFFSVPLNWKDYLNSIWMLFQLACFTVLFFSCNQRLLTYSIVIFFLKKRYKSLFFLKKNGLPRNCEIKI